MPSGYDASLYATERLMVAGARRQVDPGVVRLSRGLREDRQRAALPLCLWRLWLSPIPPGFSTDRLSLLDRGWAYAIAHIRGGDDLGYGWYLDGKAEKRWNTFHDFSMPRRG